MKHALLVVHHRLVQLYAKRNNKKMIFSI